MGHQLGFHGRLRLAAGGGLGDAAVGSVLDHEVHPAAIVGAFDRVELDQEFFVSGQGTMRSEKPQSEKRTQDATHWSASGDG